MWRDAYPDVRIDRSAFEDHLAKHAGARAEHHDELFLAWAAGRGDPAALRHVERLLAPEVAAVARRVDHGSTFRDELHQAVRVRLLVAEGGRARIADYGGRGPLGAWLGVATLRVALNLKRGARPTSAEVLGELVGDDADPELQHLKTLYRAEFRAALAVALAALSDRDRTLLRLAYVDGVSKVRLARLYQVHETTAGRWIAGAAAAVAEATRRHLIERLSLSGSSVDSIARLVLSNLELSISRVLRST